MICRYMPQKERLLLWKSTGNTVPDGYVLSHSCDVPYCGNLQHMCVRRDKTTGWSRTAHYAKLVREMKPGEFFDLPRPKNMSNFRTAIYAGAKEVKVSIRSGGDHQQCGAENTNCCYAGAFIAVRN